MSTSPQQTTETHPMRWRDGIWRPLRRPGAYLKAPERIPQRIHRVTVDQPLDSDTWTTDPGPQQYRTLYADPATVAALPEPIRVAVVSIELASRLGGTVIHPTGTSSHQDTPYQPDVEGVAFSERGYVEVTARMDSDLMANMWETLWTALTSSTPPSTTEELIELWNRHD